MDIKDAIKSPCSQDWEKMLGGDAVRHCEKCQFNVYNFAAMSQEEIDELLNSGNRVCARLFVRQDGTYMTKDCKKKVRRKSVLKYLGLAALVPLSLALFRSDSYNSAIDKARGVPGIGSIIDKLNPQPEIIMGEVCPPAPVQQAKGNIQK